MARLQRRRFADSQDVRIVPNGRIEVVELDDRVVGRLAYEPGWRWSVDIKPIAGTASCQFHHVGITLGGRVRVQMDDGVELEIGPGDVFEIPPGHDAWVIGAEPWVSVDFEAMRNFGRSEPQLGRRILSSILFTDIVDSTSQAVAHGPARWRALVGRHNELAERTIDDFSGRLIKTTGDGVIGLFDSAERAVRAALALVTRLQPLDIVIRAAVHSGEVELGQDDVRGIAVHAAARIMSVAEPGDVVVSATVHELVEGTDLEFEDYGVHQLKGLPGARTLFRVARRQGGGVQPPAAAN